MPAHAAGQEGGLSRFLSLVFPALIMMSIIVIVAPLPTIVMDVLISANVTLGVVILLTTIHVRNPLEFSVFPAILLGTTLSRLVLNVASTRLILTDAAEHGTSAAGGVIEAFGEFVAGGSPTIGVILFVILVAIQFLVITKGATRISEVAARFALDGMPGKQMAIDADLNAGIITAPEAKARREEVAQAADFYGAMDGASKFVRGDAIAGIVITLINIAGGFYVGVVNHGMTFSEAAIVFTQLTIGDGLVTQVPAFLISLAAGLIVTRTSVDSNLPRDVVTQLFRHPVAMYLAAAFLVTLSFTGLPRLPLLSLSIGCVFIGLSLQSQVKKVAAAKEQAATEQATPPKPDPKPEDHLKVDPMELEVGLSLIKLADPGAGGDLLDRVTRVRHRIAQELGMILPKVRIRDNMRLKPNQYRFKVRGVPIATADLDPTKLLAIDSGAATGNVPGIPTREPAFNRQAWWIDPGLKDRAELLGFNVVDPAAVIVTHLTELVRQHSSELLSRQQVHELLDNLKERSPRVVEDVIPDLLRVPQLHKILCNLLHERVPIRDLESILEALSNYADKTKDLTLLTEYVRHALARTICELYRDGTQTLHVVTLDPLVEDVLAGGIEFSERGLIVKLSPTTSESITQALAQPLEHLVAAGHPPVVLCPPQIRAGLKHITTTSFPNLAVISLNEVTRDTNVEALGHVGGESIRRNPTPVGAA